MVKRPFASVLEDVDWLWNEWWLGQPDHISAGHLRRASSTLRLLLVDGLLGKAWRHYGFEKQPTIEGPDLEALAAQQGLRLDLAAGVIAGGGRQNGLDLAFIGGFRVDNPSTGVPADADEGFAVEVVNVVRLASDHVSNDPLHALIHRKWYVSEYLESLSAVRRGTRITRRDVIEYFRNYAGGVHMDAGAGKHKANRSHHEIVAELERHIRADIRDGLHFELLSIGQAVAKSHDVRRLAERIRL